MYMQLYNTNVQCAIPLETTLEPARTTRETSKVIWLLITKFSLYTITVYDVVGGSDDQGRPTALGCSTSDSDHEHDSKSASMHNVHLKLVQLNSLPIIIIALPPSMKYYVVWCGGEIKIVSL